MSVDRTENEEVEIQRNLLRAALEDAVRRLRSLAKSDALRCTCQALNATTYHCEPCRALKAAEDYEDLLCRTR